MRSNPIDPSALTQTTMTDVSADAVAENTTEPAPSTVPAKEEETSKPSEDTAAEPVTESKAGDTARTEEIEKDVPPKVVENADVLAVEGPLKNDV